MIGQLALINNMSSNMNNYNVIIKHCGDLLYARIVRYNVFDRERGQIRTHDRVNWRMAAERNTRSRTRKCRFRGLTTADAVKEDQKRFKIM